MSPVPDDSEEKKTPDREDITMEDVNVNPIDFTESDDSDGDDDGHDPTLDGYMPLPQGPTMAMPDSPDSDEESSDIAQSNLSSSVGSNNSVIDQAIKNVIDADLDNSIGAVATSIFQGAESNVTADTGRSDLWNKKVEAVPLAKEQAEEVKKVMANILLPPSHHPDWAKNISDDEWKSKLLPQMGDKKEHKIPGTKKDDKR